MINSYIALDLETTGLHPKYDRILEIGAVKVIDGQVVDTYETFIDAGVMISEHITQLTGITNQMVDGAADMRTAVEKLVDFCEEYPLLGHNIIFDYSFIKHNTINYNLEFEKMGIDTLKIARTTLAHLERRNLEYLCQYYDIQQEQKHRAYYDAVVAKRLYDRLVEEFYQTNPKAFTPTPLIYQSKKESPMTNSQKVYLNDLIKYHKIELDVKIETLTKNEASRKIDQIILAHGRIKR